MCVQVYFPNPLIPKYGYRHSIIEHSCFCIGTEELYSSDSKSEISAESIITLAMLYTENIHLSCLHDHGDDYVAK